MSRMVSLDFVDVPPEMEQLFREAQRVVQRHFSRQWRDPFKAEHAVGEHRYLQIRADAMTVQFFRVVRDLYQDDDEAERIARSLLFDLAHALGIADARAFNADQPQAPSLAQLAMGPVHFAFTGWARVRVLPDSNPVAGPGFTLIFDHVNSFEAEAWHAAHEPTPQPVCVMNAGYSSGWAEAAFGQHLLATEILCRARGDACCRFVMAPPDRLKERVEDYLASHPELAARVSHVDVPGFFREKQRTAKALSRSERRFRGVFEGAPSGIALLDATGAIIEANPALADLFGVDPDALIGTRVHELLHPEDRPPIVRDLNALLDDEIARLDREVRARHLDGRVLTVQLRARLSRDAADRTGFLLYAQDRTGEREALSELRQREQQLRQAQKLDAVGRLAGGVAHDFNTLLTIMLNAAEQIEALVPANTPTHAKAVTIADAALRAGRLTRQLLAFSRQQIVVSRVCDLAAILHAAIAVTAPLLGPQIQTRVDIDDDLRGVRADPGQLEQVAVNLLLNARDALPSSGTITVRARNLTASEAPGPGAWVRLLVIDDGVGMDTETMQHLFEPFFTTRSGGTGLGLSVVHGIITQSGGSIAVESRLGVGSTLRVTLPASTETAPEVLPAPEGATGTETLLIVEDEPQIRSILARGLPRLGYRVLEAANAAEATATLEAYVGTIDLVLTDLILPDRSGVEVARQARIARPDAVIVYITGYAQAPKDLADDDDTVVIIKPFSLQSLALELRAVLDAQKPT